MRTNFSSYIYPSLQTSTLSKMKFTDTHTHTHTHTHTYIYILIYYNNHYHNINHYDKLQLVDDNFLNFSHVLARLMPSSVLVSMDIYKFYFVC